MMRLYTHERREMVASAVGGAGGFCTAAALPLAGWLLVAAARWRKLGVSGGEGCDVAAAACGASVAGGGGDDTDAMALLCLRNNELASK